jgi:hypothetical protein
MDTDRAWAAGFVDGEGSFHWNANSPGYGIPRFSVAQVDSEPMLRLIELFPFLKYRHAPGRNGCKDQHILTANGYEKVQYLLAVLWPWLSQFKRDDAVRVLSRFREQRAALNANKRRGSGIVATYGS